MSERSITMSCAEGVALIVIDRPHKKNAITLPMFAALAARLTEAEQDPGVRALVLAGAGDGFSAGHDLRAFAHWPQSADDPVPHFLHTLAELRKPLVVAVHGIAIGIGATALLHSDWVCCAPDARLRFPFVDLGIGPEAASSVLLAQAVGAMRAKRLLLGGEFFCGEEAYDWGLVSELAPASEVLDAARRRAHFLAAKPADSISGIKALLRPEREQLHLRIDREIAYINQAVMRSR